MARQTITPQHSSKDGDNNVVIDSGLRADIMRMQMESKNTLTQNGSLYVGVGKLNGTNAKTKELRSGSQYQCLNVIDANGNIGYSHLNMHHFDGQLTVGNNGEVLTVTNFGTLRIEQTGMFIINNGFLTITSNTNSYERIKFYHTYNNQSYGFGLGVIVPGGHTEPGLHIASTETGRGVTIYSNQVAIDSDVVVDSYDVHAELMYASAFIQTSDRRLKENITPFSAKKSILDLPLYKYDFINGKKNNIGCMAQDLQKICPEIVRENKDGYLGIEEDKIVFLLLEEVKKLRKEVDELKKEH